MEKTALERAIEIAGSQSALARQINTSQQNVWAWLKKADGKVPAEYVLPIEKATCGEVGRHELRPDIYPSEAA